MDKDKQRQSKEWFRSWFNSPYYHLLYKHRDEKEARNFIRHLCLYLKLENESAVLDLCCGAGRHSVLLARLGYRVTGIDLSAKNIEKAKARAKKINPGEKNLIFFRHDMRKTLKRKPFDLVLNLFTSFGYFESEKEDMDVLMAVNSTLKGKGLFVIDFINAHKAISSLKKNETLMAGNCTFRIAKRVENGFIIKNITVGKKLYSEKVRALTLKDFKKYFSSTGFRIKEIFGDYELSNFDAKNSERLIIVAEKNN